MAKKTPMPATIASGTLNIGSRRLAARDGIDSIAPKMAGGGRATRALPKKRGRAVALPREILSPPPSGPRRRPPSSADRHSERHRRTTDQCETVVERLIADAPARCNGKLLVTLTASHPDQHAPRHVPCTSESRRSAWAPL